MGAASKLHRHAGSASIGWSSRGIIVVIEFVGPKSNIEVVLHDEPNDEFEGFDFFLDFLGGSQYVCHRLDNWAIFDEVATVNGRVGMLGFVFLDDLSFDVGKAKTVDTRHDFSEVIPSFHDLSKCTSLQGFGFGSF